MGYGDCSPHLEEEMFWLALLVSMVRPRAFCSGSRRHCCLVTTGWPHTHRAPPGSKGPDVRSEAFVEKQLLLSVKFW